MPNKVLENIVDNIVILEPIVYENVMIFGLRRRKGQSALNYLLLSEAVNNKSVAVKEKNEAGSVPEIIIDNQGSLNILLIDGEEIIGGKQNRIIDSSFLIEKEAKQNIPVSCVEEGRWKYNSKAFACGSFSHIQLRRKKAGYIAQNLKSSNQYQNDQAEVWREVKGKSASLGTCSPTMSLHDVYENHCNRLNEYKKAFSDLQQIIGVIVAINGVIQCADLFDKMETMEKVKNRLIEGYALDALEVKNNDNGCYKIPHKKVEQFLRQVTQSPAASYESLGLGCDMRLESEEIIGACLIYQEEAVHLEVFNNAAGPLAIRSRCGRENGQNVYQNTIYSEDSEVLLTEEDTSETLLDIDDLDCVEPYAIPTVDFSSNFTDSETLLSEEDTSETLFDIDDLEQ